MNVAISYPSRKLIDEIAIGNGFGNTTEFIRFLVEQLDGCVDGDNEFPSFYLESMYSCAGVTRFTLLNDIWRLMECCAKVMGLESKLGVFFRNSPLKLLYEGGLISKVIEKARSKWDLKQKEFSRSAEVDLTDSIDYSDSCLDYSPSLTVSI